MGIPGSSQLALSRWNYNVVTTEESFQSDRAFNLRISPLKIFPHLPPNFIQDHPAALRNKASSPADSLCTLVSSIPKAARGCFLLSLLLFAFFLLFLFFNPPHRHSDGKSRQQKHSSIPHLSHCLLWRRVLKLCLWHIHNLFSCIHV
jgi:hypothetical protein